jgi:hypothetical protein
VTEGRAARFALRSGPGEVENEGASPGLRRKRRQVAVTLGQETSEQSPTGYRLKSQDEALMKSQKRTLPGQSG